MSPGTSSRAGITCQLDSRRTRALTCKRRVLVRKPSLYNSEHTRISECVVASIVLLVWLTALWVLPGLRKQTEIQNQASQKLPCYIYRNAF